MTGFSSSNVPLFQKIFDQASIIQQPPEPKSDLSHKCWHIIYFDPQIDTLDIQNVYMQGSKVIVHLSNSPFSTNVQISLT